MSWQQDLARIVTRKIGILLDGTHGEKAMERFVRTRCAALELDSPADYVTFISAEEVQGDELTRLISLVTNPQTHFFRDPELFAVLEGLIAERARKGDAPVKIWSAACATGEEVFTVALICQQLGIDARIVGSDIDPESLQIARAGHYHSWSLRRMPSGLLARFFTARGDSYMLDEEVKRRVQLVRHNLLDPPPPSPDGASGGWDIVLCRNVFIYFGEDSRLQAERNLAAALSPDGVLFLGASEILGSRNETLEIVAVGGRMGYQRMGNAGPRQPRLKASQPAPPVVAPAPPEEVPAAAVDGAFADAVTSIEDELFEEAKSRLQDLLEQRPWHVEARITFGNLLLRDGSTEEALGHYLDAQSHAPLAVAPHFLQGMAYRRLQDLERAKGALRRALFLEPTYWPASFLLGRVYTQLGMKTHGRRELQRTLDILTRDQRMATVDLIGLDQFDIETDNVVSFCRRHVGW